MLTTQCDKGRQREIRSVTATPMMMEELLGETETDKVYLDKPQREKNLMKLTVNEELIDSVALHATGASIHFLPPNHAVSFWGFTSAPLGLTEEGIPGARFPDRNWSPQSLPL